MTKQHNIIKWGFSSIGCPDASLENMLLIAKRNKIDAIELRCFPGKLGQPGYCQISESAKTSSLLKSHNIELVMLDGNCALIGGGSNADKEFIELAELANKLKVKYIRVFGGVEWSETLNEKMLKEAGNTIKRRQKMLAKYKWDVAAALETHSIFSSGANVKSLLKYINIAVVWDIHHTVYLGKETPKTTWNMLKDNIVHVHVKDSIAKPSFKSPYTLTLPGEGVIPILEAINILKRENFPGVVSLEWEKRWHHYLPELETALKALFSAGWKTQNNMETAK
jgi:sugar phosphate isomerase/epimerase